MSRRTPKDIPVDQNSQTYLRQHLEEQARQNALPPLTGNTPGADGHSDCGGRGCRECTG